MNRKIIRYLKKYWFLTILTPLLMVGEVFVDLQLPTLMADIVDKGVVPGDLAEVWSIGIRMLIYVVAGGLFGILAAFTSSVVSQNFGTDLRNDTFKKVMSLSLQQTDKFTVGSLVTRLTNDISQVQNFVAMLLRMFVRAPLNFLGGIVMALKLSGQFAGVILLALPIQLVIIVLILRKTTPLFGIVQKKLDHVNSVVQENVTGARVVKAYVREDYETNRFNDANADLRNTSMDVQYRMAMLFPLISIVMYISVIAIILIGGFQIEAAKLEVGKVMAAVTYVTQILMSLMMVAMMFQTIARANASAKRITEVLDSTPSIIQGSKENGLTSEGSVRFENVSFQYPGTSGQPVLSNINLDIKPGEYVAVLGATGSGKTSLLNLVSRFYDATDGTVYIDGLDVREYKLSALRSKIGFVLQKSELFSGTVTENIRWGNPEATDEEIRHAAKIAQADDFISDFKDGYNTIIEEKGASLSGGQKQRISIARAILRKPEILIFDDSTSALDLGTESRLRAALKENLKGTTIIMIAQRIASVMQADRIAVIENGKIVACGPHAELMKTSEQYRDIYNSQIREEAEKNA